MGYRLFAVEPCREGMRLRAIGTEEAVKGATLDEALAVLKQRGYGQHWPVENRVAGAPELNRVLLIRIEEPREHEGQS